MTTVQIPQFDAVNGTGPVLARRAIAAARTLAQLDVGPPAALAEHQRVSLEAFPGWGPVSALFDAEPAGPWAELADELEDAAGEAMAKAARVVDTSFFSPPELVAHIWGVLCAAGFAGGSVLDLGCGSGAFLRHAPADLPIWYDGCRSGPNLWANRPPAASWRDYHHRRPANDFVAVHAV